MEKNFVAISLLVISLIFLNYCRPKENGKSLTGNAGEPAPDFKITSVDGQEFTLDSFRGKVVLINFWATWCPPCRAEIPDLIEAYSELKDKGLVILGFSVDDLPEAELKKFVEQAKINYPVALIGRDIVSAFRPGQYIPTSIFIDKKGNIRARHVGKLEKADLLKVFDELNKE
ncbi:MAG: TlpA family protein disulfide reductase [Candidatus Saccharicenans sp.]